MKRTNTIRKGQRRDVWQWIGMLLLLTCFAWYESRGKGEQTATNAGPMKYSTQKHPTFLVH